MKTEKQGRVTLKDVAWKSGYTINTVSRAMRDDEKLPVETREKIRDMALNMGYIPNSLASTLRSGTSRIVAVIVNDVRNQHFSIMLSKIDESLRQAGYITMILCMQLSEEMGERLIQTALSHSVAGILYFPFHENRKHIEQMMNHVPFVLVDRWIRGVEADCARCDDEMGGYLAGRHLAALGHRRFLHLAGVIASSSELDRYKGFVRALAEADLPAEAVRTVEWDVLDRTIRNNTYEKVLIPLDYTAIFAFSDELAYHALNALSAMKISVPDDVSIISFDHIRSGILYMPRLTSIYAAEDHVAYSAVRLLLSRMKNPNSPVQTDILPVKIYDEGTTAPPRRFQCPT